MPKYWNTGRQAEQMEQHGKMHGNKPRVKLDLNLENVIGCVITLKIAKGNCYMRRIYVKIRKSMHGIKRTSNILFYFYSYYIN